MLNNFGYTNYYYPGNITSNLPGLDSVSISALS